MILIGQYDSPFVRRVAVALRIYGLAYEHRPWSTFRNGAEIAAYNPLMRVPTLVLDDGETLFESAAILDHLDELAGPAALIQKAGLERRHALKICALGNGLSDKAVSLVYERLLHEPISPVWSERCARQISGALDALELERAKIASPFWFGDKPGHADIAVACGLRFAFEAHSTILAGREWPHLAAHSARCEALDEFQSVVQPFIPPA